MAHRTLLLLPWLALAACADARDQGERADPSLCNEELDSFCDPDEPRLDSVEAVALLRQRFPAAEIYALSGTGGLTLNVDGRDTAWEFVLRSEPGGAGFSASVDAASGVDANENDFDCTGTPFEPLDSRRVVHEALALLEARVRPFPHELGRLTLEQHVCGFEWQPEAHYVRISAPRSDEDVEPRVYYARFRHDGELIDFVGPCADRDLANCLAGVVVEPDE